MEEKKKRVRPTLTAFRALEREIEGHLEDKSRLVSACDDWREKYREALGRAEGLVAENGRLKDEVSRLKDEVSRQNEDISNLKSRLSRYDGTLKDVLREKEALHQRIDQLNARGFWKRLFNK